MSDSAPTDLLRALDASMNRASEAARVVEDYTRFILDDQGLTRLAKSIRHDLARATESTPIDARLAARDTQGDVGREVTTPTEGIRQDAWHVCQANLNRLHQSLRSIEEFSKTLDPALAQKIEAMRYRSYTLAKAIGATREGRERLGGVKLYVLVDGLESEQAFGKLVATLCDAGVGALQLRDKRLADRALLDRARMLVSICSQAGVVSIVNDRPDVARIARADGVHLGQEELSVRDARGVVGPEALIGISTHNVDQLRQAVLDGAGYVGLGPTFASSTKSFDSLSGLEYLAAAAAESTLPGFAIGGITPSNLDEVLATGIERIAVGAAITQVPDPAEATKELLELLNAPRPTAIGSGAEQG